MPVRPHRFQPLTIKEFKGVNTQESPGSLPDGYFQKAQNVNVTDAFTFVKRRGINKVSTTQITGGANSIRLLGRHITETGDKLYFARINIVGVATQVWRCNTINLGSAEQVTFSGSSITGYLYGFQAGDVFYILVRNVGIRAVTMASAASTSTGGPGGTHGIVHKSRMFVLNSLYGSGAPVTRVFYSAVGNFTSWPAANNFDVSFGDGFPCTEFAILNDLLVIFKYNSVWTINTDSADPTNWQLRSISNDLGCVGRGTVQEVDGFLYFLSARGVYRTDGVNFEELSHDIKDDLHAIIPISVSDTSLIEFDSCFFDDKYILHESFWKTLPNWYVFHTRTNTWTTWNIHPSLEPSGMLVCDDRILGSGVAGIMFGNANDTGLVYQYTEENTWQDETNNFSVEINTKEFDLDAPTMMKRHYYTDLDVADAGGVFPLSITYHIDTEDTVAGLDNTTNTHRKNMKFRGAGYFRFMWIEISYLQAGPLEIHSLSLNVELRDRTSYAH